MKKRIVALLLALITVLAFASCGEKSPVTDETTVEDVKDVVTPDIPHFATLLEGALSNASKLTAVEDDYVEAMMEIDLTNVEAYTVRIQTMGTAIDQYGIFKAADEKGVKVLVFPELTLTGSTCGDLYLTDSLQKNALTALETVP